MHENILDVIMHCKMTIIELPKEIKDEATCTSSAEGTKLETIYIAAAAQGKDGKESFIFSSSTNTHFL